MADPEEFLIHTDNWVDVVENREDYEYLFDLPTEEDLRALRPGDSVKISNGAERFFVLVTEVRSDCFIGTVDNHLRGNYDYVFGDRVRFEGRHVFAIRRAEEAPRKMAKTTARMVKMLGLDPSKSAKHAMMFESLQK